MQPLLDPSILARRAFTVTSEPELHEELGHRYVKSNANFTFFQTGRDVREVNAAFRKENIMVGRPFPPMTDWLRVSMAKPDEMRYFVQTYKKLYG